MLAVIFMLAQATQEAPAIPPLMTVQEQAQSPLSDRALGSCLRQGTPFDLRRVWLLENRTVDLSTPAGPLRVTIERDNLKIDEVGENSKRTRYIWNVGYMFEDERGALDVQLKLGVLNGDLVLYWRETYQNRLYRQGLFRIAGRELVPLCEGRGGIEMSH